jgi:exopolysaccharide biosynthesis predicted pyruvyltransferase EpsI
MTSTDSATHVNGLRERLLSTLREVLPDAPRWTALDYPMHFNCGDAALHLGLEATARELGKPVVRVLDRVSFRPHLVADDSLVVIQAGGNFGGLYPTHHKLRMRVLEETRGREVVQLPQSVEYVDEAHREQLRRAVGEHGAFTLLVRDRRSHDIAVRDFDCPVHLVPDLAFALGPLARRPARVPRVVQARTDKEASSRTVAGETFDWLQAPATSPSALLLRLGRRVNAQQRRTASPLVSDLNRRVLHRLAQANLDRAVGLLSRGEQVVTDRLHGHVLSTLLGIPHVVVNDRFGKIQALYDTWTAADPTSAFAADWAGVEEAAASLPAGQPTQQR